MRVGCKVLIILFITLIILAPCTSTASAKGSCEAFSKTVHDIEINFPDDNKVYSGKDMTFEATSDKYDLNKSQIYLYKYNKFEEPSEPRIGIDSMLESNPSGNTVIYTVKNVQEDFEILFIDPVEFTEQPQISDDANMPNISDDINSKIIESTEKNINTFMSILILLASLVLFAIFIQTYRQIIKIINSEEDIV